MDNNIHNYYETVVFQKLVLKSKEDQSLTEEHWSDIACVALNHLPPRYVRHSVDMSFYTSPQEKLEMEERIMAAINNAIEYVRHNPEESEQQEINQTVN